MMTETMSVAASNDPELVSKSLTGNRDAFGQIVARYQSLICSLAYSATGSLDQSEDLAQETFVAAWKQLGNLREPQKLRSWLCQIARNLASDALKKQGREPSHRAGSLEEISEAPSPEPQPVEQTISNEEQAILWRSLERIPEIYREPLVLYYREHQSIETVAANLDMTEDAVKQRLSRGRKLLQEQVLAFIEGALERTNPGKVFTLGVLAALPSLTISAKAATLGAAVAKGGASIKTAGAMGLLGVMANPVVVILFGNYIPYRIGLAEAQSDDERSHVKSFYRKTCAWSIGLSIALMAALYLIFRNQYDGHNFLLDLFLTWFVSFIVVYLLMVFSTTIATSGKRRAYYSKVLAQEHGGVFPKPAFEYRSKTKLFGLPLVHIRISDRFDMLKKPTAAWIAVGGRAVGGLFAFGGVAVAPLSIGGLAIGLLPFGGLTLGAIALGGGSFGIWTFGGIAVGWQSFGACAIAWSAAVGNFALAHHFALGEIARAIQSNNDIAHRFADSNLFFRWIRVINSHWLWMNLLWILPLAVQWWLVARKNKMTAISNVGQN